MKAIYTLVLVIAVQVIAMSQTQENRISQAKNPLISTIKRNTEMKESISTPKPDNNSQFSKRIEQLNEQIIELESLKGKINDEINSFFITQQKQKEENDFVRNSSPETKTASLSKAEMIIYLLKEADELTKKGSQLRNEARIAYGIQKKQFLTAAQKVFDEAFLKQIEASQISGVIANGKFRENQQLINDLLSSNQDKYFLCAQVKNIVTEAERAMKLAAEIREESMALESAAKLGGFGNAEEKEFVALDKQQEALSLFDESYIVQRD
ncbi:MAG: hypothetical protein Q8M29_19365 [Bacteroidota bacterium]|nr:hypothetical protein [Bacteroidota bacterium]